MSSSFHARSLGRKCIAQTASKSYHLNRLSASQQQAMNEGPWEQYAVNKRRLVFWIIVALCVIVTLWFYMRIDFRTKVTQEDLALCADRMRVTFPKSTRPIGIWYQYGMDDAICLKIEIAKSDLGVFIRESPLSNEKLENDWRFLLEPDKGWWDPSKPKILLSGQAGLPNAQFLNIGIDYLPDDKVIIYLMWHET